MERLWRKCHNGVDAGTTSPLNTLRDLHTSAKEMYRDYDGDMREISHNMMDMEIKPIEYFKLIYNTLSTMKIKTE